MLPSAFYSLLLITLSGVFGSSALPQEKERPVTFSLNIVSGESSFSPGDRVTLALTARIDSGWHLYSLSQPTAEGPKPTRISLIDQLPLKLLSVSEQAPKVEFDRNFNFETAWHSGTAIFRLNTAVMANARSGQQLVRAALWSRLQHRAQRAKAALLVVTEKPLAQSFAVATLGFVDDGMRWQAAPGGRLQLCARQARIEVLRSRLGAPGDVQPFCLAR